MSAQELSAAESAEVQRFGIHTPAEELDAAIAKLSTLQAGITAGSWGGHQNILGVDRVRAADGYIVAEVYGDNSQEANAELIVTLHRTIDAQLAILREGLALIESNEDVELLYANELALGRAINEGAL